MLGRKYYILTLLISLCALTLIGQSTGVSVLGGPPNTNTCTFHSISLTGTGSGLCLGSRVVSNPATCNASNQSTCVVTAPVRYNTLRCTATEFTPSGWDAGDQVDFIVQERVFAGAPATEAIVKTVSVEPAGCVKSDTVQCYGQTAGMSWPLDVVGPTTSGVVVLQIKYGAGVDGGTALTNRFECILEYMN